MAKITLHKDNENTTTSVPNQFIDEYMTNANGEFVKIYLYLLRCMNSPECSFSISKTADKFEHTEKDIQRALKYWEKMNLLRLEYDEDKRISGIYFLDSASCAPKAEDTISLKQAAPESVQTASALSDAAQSSLPGQAAAFEKPSYTADDMRRFREKEEVQELLFVAESYLGKTLTPTNIQTLLFWYDGLGFSTDLIEYLMEYCIAKGHSSLRYMEKVALNWKESNVKTVEQAKRSVSTHSQLHFSVMKAMGISGRNLVPAEMSYIDKWTRNLGFGQDIILEACNRTILATHQPSFEYADRILSNWFKQQVHSLSDIAKADETYQKSKITTRTVKAPIPNRFNNFPQRTYNLDQLEAQLLNSVH